MDNINFEQIRISFSLEGCKKNFSYEIEFSLENYDTFKSDLVKSESDDSLIQFSKIFLCDYHFSKIQFFKLGVRRWKNRQHFVLNKIKEKENLTLSSLISKKNAIYKCTINENVPNSENIIIKIDNPNYIEQKLSNKYTLFDFLKAGVNLEGYIGIDFTDGIEHIKEMESNQYMQAIEGFRETLFYFIREFQVYGFGAQVNNSIEYMNSEYFNLSLKENSSLYGYTNIEKAYEEVLNKITYSKRSNISPLINDIKKIIYSRYKPDTYSILFLLINSVPKEEDYKKCIDAFIENSYLPLSVIIIGIGNNELDEVKKLFNPKIKFSSQGIEKFRNNVNYISMKDCNFNNEILKNKCLKDIPMQLVEYYSLSRTTPDNIKEKKLDNIKKSYQILDRCSLLNGGEEDGDEGSAPPTFNIPKKEEININNINIIPNNNNNNNNIILNKKDEEINKDISNPNEQYYQKPVPKGFSEEGYNNIKNSNYYINDNHGNDRKQFIANPYSNEKRNEMQKEILRNNGVIDNDKKYDTPSGNENSNFKGYMNNPYHINKNENYINNYNNINENNITNDNINRIIEKREDDKMYNKTPDGNEQQNPKKKISNPYNNQKKGNEEDIKEDAKFSDKNNNFNNNIQDKKYFNETPGREEKNNIYNIQDKTYFNETPGRQEKNNNNNKINPYKKKDEKFYNETPNPDSNNKNKEDNRKNINNPFAKNNNINEKDNKKYVNNQNNVNKQNNKKYISNPFVKNNNNGNQQQNNKEENAKKNNKESDDKSIIFEDMNNKNSNMDNLGQSRENYKKFDYSVDA